MDAAAVELISTQVASAMADYATGHMTKGIADAPSRGQEIGQARRTIANLVGSAPDRIAFTQNTSTGMALVANGIDWAPGDNIVIPSAAFPSNFYPWTQLRRLGVELREVTMRGGHAPVDALAAAVDAHTRVLTISSVSTHPATAMTSPPCQRSPTGTWPSWSSMAPTGRQGCAAGLACGRRFEWPSTACQAVASARFLMPFSMPVSM